MLDQTFNAELRSYLENIESEFRGIPAERLRILTGIGDHIISFIKEHREALIIFICTHNSRRSQFGQVWAETAAQYYGIKGIRCYSGGTEATAFNTRAVAAIRRAGFRVEKMKEHKDNTRYLISNGHHPPSGPMFSKKYDDPANPRTNFLAIMVCSDADEACPFIPGAGNRISLPYDDPKAYDGTGQESRKYDERCREMARDLCYVFNYLREKQ